MLSVGGSNPRGPNIQSLINTDFLLAEHSSCALAYEERQLVNVGAETLVTRHLRFPLAAEFGIIFMVQAVCYPHEASHDLCR